MLHCFGPLPTPVRLHDPFEIFLLHFMLPPVTSRRARSERITDVVATTSDSANPVASPKRPTKMKICRFSM